MANSEHSFPTTQLYLRRHLQPSLNTLAFSDLRSEIKQTSVNQMSCTTDEAYAYFSGIAKDDDYAGFPSWINMVINIPHGESINEFDMSPITPRTS